MKPKDPTASITIITGSDGIFILLSQLNYIEWLITLDKAEST